MADVIAWHGDPELKARIVERMKQHREADDLIQGVYQRLDPGTALGYRGCAIGCLLDRRAPDLFGTPNEPEPGWHGEVEKQFGIPAHVAQHIDNCFEWLEKPEHAEFAIAAIEAIPVGADLSGVDDAYLDAAADDEDPPKLLELLKTAPVRRAVSQ